MQTQLLDRLCALHGITLEYYDIRGDIHGVPEATKLALLAALGVSLNSGRDAEGALGEIEARQWRRTLPPVQVVRENEAPHSIVLILPAGHADQRVDWVLEFEAGGQLSGAVRPVDLPLVEERMLDGVGLCRYRFTLQASPPRATTVSDSRNPAGPVQAAPP